MLDLSVNFLAGTYHGMEWPPSPARLFQALLAGSRFRYRRGEGWRSEFDDALLWLEAQPAPVIVATRPVKGMPYLIFGPDNDMDLWVWDRLTEARGRVLRRPTDIASMRSQLERHPTYVSGSLHYLYPDNQVPLAALKEMAHSLLAMGHGVDMACGDAEVITDEESQRLNGDRWIPDAGGTVVLFAPAEGWYRRLEENFQRWSHAHSYATRSVDARRSTVPPSLRGVTYRDPSAQISRPYVAFTLERLEDGRPSSVPWEDGMEISAQLRHAVSEVLRSAGAEETFLRVYILGHGTGKDRDNRLSYVPLPSIGHQFVDGRVRRILVLGPRGPWDTRAKSLASLLDGARLTAPDALPTTCLVPTSTDDPVLARYFGPSRTWSSVTPVVLHGHDARRGQINVSRTRSLIEEALEQAGLGRAVQSYAYRNAPWWPGTGAARSMRVPAHLGTWPRYHLRIEFRREVGGPLLVGIGRHYGIGLFAAEESRSASAHGT